MCSARDSVDRGCCPCDRDGGWPTPRRKFRSGLGLQPVEALSGERGSSLVGPRDQPPGSSPIAGRAHGPKTAEPPCDGAREVRGQDVAGCPQSQKNGASRTAGNAAGQAQSVASASASASTQACCLGIDLDQFDEWMETAYPDYRMRQGSSDLKRTLAGLRDLERDREERIAGVLRPQGARFGCACSLRGRAAAVAPCSALDRGPRCSGHRAAPS